MKLHVDDVSVVNIRLAEPQDQARIMKIQLDALQILAAKDYDEEQLDALLANKRMQRETDEIIFIAEIKSKVVGFASLLSSYNTIGAVFVDPNFVRKGVGSKLLTNIEQEAKKHSVPILWVCSSLTGYYFYKANGYRTLSTTVLPLDSTYIPCKQMKKRILPITTREIFDEISQLLMAMVVMILLVSFFTQIR